MLALCHHRRLKVVFLLAGFFDKDSCPPTNCFHPCTCLHVDTHNTDDEQIRFGLSVGMASPTFRTAKLCVVIVVVSTEAGQLLPG